MFKLLILTAVLGVAFSTPTAKIAPALLATLDAKHNANVIVTFVGSNHKVLNTIEATTFTTRTERLTTLTSSLKAHTQVSQQEVQAFLNEKSINFQSFWVSNKIYLQGANRDLVEHLATFPNVEFIREEYVIQLDDPIDIPSNDPTPLAEWGIERVQAEAAWAISNGTGVTVSTIDTGVRVTHEALSTSYRSDYGWFDPYQGTQTPNDGQSHGTHTMGTIVGTHGIGVAPGANWIACKGCDNSGGCSESSLERCGAWTLCPTLWDGTGEDCSKAPALSSNSWGGPGGDLWYEAVTEAWVVGGIIPISSNGNSGTSCETAGSPGDYRRVIGVGSTNSQDELSYYSSVGPAELDRRIKPEISAPGENVRSSIPDSDTSYGSKSGTSMACPHVAGVAALLLSIEPNLSFGEVRSALLEGTDQNLVAENRVCSGLNDGSYPNNHFGWGLTNALKVVQAAQARAAKH